MRSSKKSFVTLMLFGFVHLMFSYTVLSQVPVPPPVVPVPVAPVPDASAVAVPAPVVPAVVPVPPAPVPSVPVPPAPVPVVPAPVAPVAPAAPAPVAAPGSVGLTPPAPVPPAPAAPVQPPVEEKYKKEFDDINEAMNRIKALEDEIKGLFNSFDEKLTQARGIALSIKDESFDILKQDTEQKARDLFAKMQGELKQLKDIQAFAQGDFNKTNSDKITEVNNLITKVNGILIPLKTVAALVSQSPVGAAAPAQAAPAQAAPAAPNVVAKEVNQASESSSTVNPSEKSLSSIIWVKITDMIVSGIMGFNRAVDWAASWIRPYEKKKQRR